MAKLALVGVLIAAFAALSAAIEGVLKSTPFWSSVVTYSLLVAFLLLGRWLGLFSKDRG